MGTHRTCYPDEAEPTCCTVCRTRDGALPVTTVGLHAVVPHAARRFVCETHCPCWERVQIQMGLSVVAQTAVEGRKTLADLAYCPSPSPWLSVMVEVGVLLKPTRADVVMVAVR